MKRLISAAETAKKLGINQQTVYRYIRRGVLPCVRLGRNVKVDPDALQKWISNGGITNTEDTEETADMLDEWPATNEDTLKEWQATQAAALDAFQIANEAALDELQAACLVYFTDADTPPKKSRRRDKPPD